MGVGGQPYDVRKLIRLGSPSHLIDGIDAAIVAFFASNSTSAVLILSCLVCVGTLIEPTASLDGEPDVHELFAWQPFGAFFTIVGSLHRSSFSSLREINGLHCSLNCGGGSGGIVRDVSR